MLTFEIEPRDLSSFDEANSAWLAEAGTYELRLGSSSKSIQQQASFTLKSDVVVETVSKALTPQRAIKYLKKS